jgi:hypothetical protein
VTEGKKTGGQRKTLPVIFALTVAGAGALALLFTKAGDGHIAPSFAESGPPGARPVPAAPTARSAQENSPSSNQQHELDIERALVSNNPALRETAFNVALPALLDSDPRRVIELVARQQGEARDFLRDEVVRQWIRKDGEAARIWMGSLEAEERDASAIVAMRTLAAIDPAQAVAVADEFEVGRDDGSLEHLVQARVEQVRAQSSPDQRD